MAFGFQKIFLDLFRGCIKGIRKEASIEHVRSDEIASRFLFYSSDYTSSTKHLKKHTRLMPNYNTKTDMLETSVYRISNLDEKSIWDLGDKFAGSPKDNAKARADISVLDIRDIQLNIVSEKTPHPLHANIIGWPIEKDAQIEKAKLLRNKISLIERT